MLCTVFVASVLVAVGIHGECWHHCGVRDVCVYACLCARAGVCEFVCVCVCVFVCVCYARMYVLHDTAAARLFAAGAHASRQADRICHRLEARMRRDAPYSTLAIGCPGPRSLPSPAADTRWHPARLGRVAWA
jgi:hypothetical protein